MSNLFLDKEGRLKQRNCNEELKTCPFKQIVDLYLEVDDIKEDVAFTYIVFIVYLKIFPAILLKCYVTL